jgi:hypothetical protein
MNADERFAACLGERPQCLNKIGVLVGRHTDTVVAIS